MGLYNDIWKRHDTTRHDTIPSKAYIQLSYTYNDVAFVKNNSQLSFMTNLNAGENTYQI